MIVSVVQPRPNSIWDQGSGTWCRNLTRITARKCRYWKWLILVRCKLQAICFIASFENDSRQKYESIDFGSGEYSNYENSWGFITQWYNNHAFTILNFFWVKWCFVWTRKKVESQTKKSAISLLTIAMKNSLQLSILAKTFLAINKHTMSVFIFAFLCFC